MADDILAPIDESDAMMNYEDDPPNSPTALRLCGTTSSDGVTRYKINTPATREVRQQLGVTDRGARTVNISESLCL